MVVKRLEIAHVLAWNKDPTFPCITLSLFRASLPPPTPSFFFLFLCVSSVVSWLIVSFYPHPSLPPPPFRPFLCCFLVVFLIPCPPPPFLTPQVFLLCRTRVEVDGGCSVWRRVGTTKPKWGTSETCYSFLTAQSTR